MGGEPTFVVDRRHGRRGVEHGRRRAEQARAMPTSWSGGCASGSRPAGCCTTARANGIRASSCRAGRSRSTGAPTASRCGEDPDLLAGEKRDHGNGDDRRCRALHRAASRERAGPARRQRHPGLRGPGHFLLDEQKLPVNVDAGRQQARTTRRAHAHRARVRARPRQAGRLRAAAAGVADRGSRPALGDASLGAAARAAVPDARRLAGRLPPAARLAALAAGATIRTCCRAIRSPMRRRLPERRVLMQRRRTVALEAADRSRRQRHAEIAAGSVRTAPVRRAARRPALRVHAAAGTMPRTTRAGRGDRGDGARHSACRCMIEGYRRPHDPRLNVHQGDARPRRDRGQHPSGAHWDELVAITDGALRGGAALPRLGTEKFMLDGRHTGTGGGNHVVLGGATPGRQPVPAPARSAAPRWSPTGRTIRRCPTCSPACSSARPARRRASTRRATTRSTSWRSRSTQIPDPSAGYCRRRGWSTGSSAICWSTSPATRTAPRSASTSCTRPTARPAGWAWSSSASFEMPPHARMSLAQQLLLRALVVDVLGAALPAAAGALGHGAARPVHAAALPVAGLRRRDRRPRARPACRSSSTWFAPHFEFRFPRYGAVDARRRRAGAAPGARAVARAGRGGRRRRHGALRRLLARARAGQGARADRRALRRDLQRPQRAAGADRDQRRGGGRRALSRLAAAVGLHPTIAVHAPLAFDIVDTWTRRSIAGCRYHVRIRADAVSRPSRSMPTRPRDAGSPGSRPHGHTAGQMMPQPAAVNPDYPLTLDLRRQR